MGYCNFRLFIICNDCNLNYVNECDVNCVNVYDVIVVVVVVCLRPFWSPPRGGVLARLFYTTRFLPSS
jgi:hypothetical protein